jgi:uncharacterized protein (DUF1778 family)
MAKTKLIPQDLLTITITIYRSELEKIDRAVVLKNLRSRSAFIVDAALSKASKLISDEKNILPN